MKHMLFDRYAEGWRARQIGESRSSNPYAPQSPESRSWLRGWEDDPDLEIKVTDNTILEEAA